jgi:hypothetical protein
VVPIRIVSREVEKINTGKNDEESTEKGNCIDGIRGIESLEQNERGAKRSGRKCDIIERVHAVKGRNHRLATIETFGCALQLTWRLKIHSTPC